MTEKAENDTDFPVDNQVDNRSSQAEKPLISAHFFKKI